MKTKRRKPQKQKSPMDRKTGPLKRKFSKAGGVRIVGQIELYDFQMPTYERGVITQLWHEHRVSEQRAIKLITKHKKVIRKCFRDFKNYSQATACVMAAEG